MSRVNASSETSTADSEVGAADMKLEVVVVPVSDVDRAKGFYQTLGWRLDADYIDGRYHQPRLTWARRRSRSLIRRHEADCSGMSPLILRRLLTGRAESGD